MGGQGAGKEEFFLPFILTKTFNGFDSFVSILINLVLVTASICHDNFAVLRRTEASVSNRVPSRCDLLCYLKTDEPL